MTTRAEIFQIRNELNEVVNCCWSRTTAIKRALSFQSHGNHRYHVTKQDSAEWYASEEYIQYNARRRTEQQY